VNLVDNQNGRNSSIVWLASAGNAWLVEHFL